MANAVSKTERILSIYYLLTHCEEVSMQELTDNLPCCKRTFSRYLSLLRQAGVPVRYSASRQAFILAEQGLRPIQTVEEASAARYLAKLRRLIILIDQLPAEDCDRWYQEQFPNVSRRTMQRDFAVLGALGFCIRYERDSWNIHDAGIDLPPFHYYCDRPASAYNLATFQKKAE